MPTLDENSKVKDRNENKFGDDAMKNINALGDVLRHIHSRLVTEGYLNLYPGGRMWNIFKCSPKPFCEVEIKEDEINYKQ